MEIEKLFEQEVLEGCRELSKKHHYTPTYFLQMVQERGAVRTTKDLLASKEPSEGLNTLWHLGKLDMSVEAMVLDTRYESLFTEEERRIARKRLADLDYQPQSGE
jgi:hypothetical protein